jgi:prolyl 4-hydroxylase
MAGSPLTQRAEALASAGRIADAYGLLTGPAADADGDALVTLASWRLSGQLIRRDIAEARRLFGRAADLGHAAAEPIYTAMLANGAGGGGRWADALARLRRRAERDPAARRELALIAAMPLTEAGDPVSAPAPETICTAPRVALVRALASPDECRFLIDTALPLLRPSVVVDPRSGQFIHDPVRTSAAAAFPFVLESPAIHAICRRIARVTGTAPEQGEPPQVLRYTPGQEYKPHLDALAGTDNQRVITALIYLNDDYDGGETAFPQAGLKVRGRMGDALLFRNVTPSGAADATARHAGLAVRRGQKFLLSRWIRARPLDLAGPPGRPF